MVVFKMRDSVPSASYSSVCNVLRQWNIPLTPTYRVYRLYDMHKWLNAGIRSLGMRHNAGVRSLGMRLGSPK